MTTPRSTLWVSNLPLDTSEEEVRTLFSKYGKIFKVTLLEKNGNTKCIAFVFYTRTSDAAVALKELDNYSFHDRLLCVRYADPHFSEKQGRDIENSKKVYDPDYDYDYSRHSRRDKDHKSKKHKSHHSHREKDRDRESSQKHSRREHLRDNEYNLPPPIHAYPPPYAYGDYYDAHYPGYAEIPPLPPRYPPGIDPYYRYPADIERPAYPPPPPRIAPERLYPPEVDYPPYPPPKAPYSSERARYPDPARYPPHAVRYPHEPEAYPIDIDRAPYPYPPPAYPEYRGSPYRPPHDLSPPQPMYSPSYQEEPVFQESDED